MREPDDAQLELRHRLFLLRLPDRGVHYAEPCVHHVVAVQLLGPKGLLPDGQRVLPVLLGVGQHPHQAEAVLQYLGRGLPHLQYRGVNPLERLPHEDGLLPHGGDPLLPDARHIAGDAAELDVAPHLVRHLEQGLR